MSRYGSLLENQRPVPANHQESKVTSVPTVTPPPPIEQEHQHTQDEQASNNATIIQARKQTAHKPIKQSSNITILQLLTDEDIEELQEPAYQAQTFRLTEKEIDWIKDIAYQLSKKVKRGKVSQTNIVRLSFKLFEKMLASNDSELMTILEKIK
jgi:hypothetical protein